MEIYKSFIKLADKKKEIFDDDLRMIMGDSISRKDDYYVLENIQVSSGSKSIPAAVVTIKTKDEVLQESSIGDGPIDAVFNAIERALNITPEVESYNVRSVTSGRQAMGEVLVRIRTKDNRSFTGRGVSTDIIEASALAYLSAQNKKKFSQKEEAIADEENNLTKVG